MLIQSIIKEHNYMKVETRDLKVHISNSELKNLVKFIQHNMKYNMDDKTMTDLAYGYIDRLARLERIESGNCDVLLDRRLEFEL